MAAAVERLLLAREHNEQLVIFGDYDVDGVTSTALLVEVLRALGWCVEFYLPSRMDEGYGLSTDGVENCLKEISLSSCCSPWTVVRQRWKPSPGSTPGGWMSSSSIIIKFSILHPPPSHSQTAACFRKSGRKPEIGDRKFSENFVFAGLAFKLAHALVKRGRELTCPAPRNLI